MYILSYIALTMSRIPRNKPPKLNLFWLLLTGLVIQSSLLSAQQKEGNWHDMQVAQATAVYKKQFSGPNSPVYQGYQYVPFILPATGDPFYPTADWHSGSVLFKGNVYSHLSLLYDILKDQLVLKSANGLYRILLNQKEVGWFTLDSLRFIHIDATQPKGGDVPPPGYYEQLVEASPVALLAKRKTSVQIPVSSGDTRSFRAQNLYYIKRGHQYYKVRTRHSVLKALKEQRREIRRYLRKRNIYFSQEREQAIRQAVIFYNKTKK